jgi:fatty-acyl-CoA synthase
MSTMPAARTIPRLVDELARTWGPRPALSGCGRSLTYTGMRDEALRIARRLHRLGVRRGDKVGILMGNRVEWVTSCLAITSLGAVMVSLNTWATVRELHYMLAHSETRTLIAHPGFLKADYGAMLRELEPHAEHVPRLREILGSGESLPPGWLPLFDGASENDAADDAVIAEAFAAVNPEDIAYLLYTSGSTAKPKGVQLQHYPLIENLWNIGERMHVTEHDRLWLAVSMFWGLGCSNALFNLLTHGGSIVLQESFEPGEALRLIEEEKCTLFYGTANMAQAMHEHPDRTKRDLSSLRSGAAVGTREQMQRVVELGATQICNIYGMTEGYGNCHVADAHDSQECRFASVGKLLPNRQQKIVSPKGQVLPPGSVGEICLKGYMTPGYYKDPAATAQAFDGEGYFKTGDLGYLDAAGYLYFRGRLKEMVKTGGINVSPAEVEEVLMSFPGVHLAQVVGVPDAMRDEVLAAVIVARPGVTLDAQAITTHCKTVLAAYKVPRLMRFVEERELPLTTTGKIQKNRIAATFFPPE